MRRDLWSLWDMLEADAGRLFEAVIFVAVSVGALQRMTQDSHTAIMEHEDFDKFFQQTEMLKKAVDDMGLSMCGAVAEELLAAIALVRTRTKGDERVHLSTSEQIKIAGHLERLTALQYEARTKMFLGLDAAGTQLWSVPSPPFGQDVDDAFPSARDDIEEASKCLAVERGTACVMHLMRATEAPLKALAANLNVGLQNDWGSYIREIDKELTSRMKAAGKRSKEESFYAEASESFERVKRAWRNKSMHLEHSYTTARAREIFDATRGFMAYLAPTIHE